MHSKILMILNQKLSQKTFTVRSRNGLNSKDVTVSSRHVKWKSTEGQAGYNGIKPAPDSGMNECVRI